MDLAFEVVVVDDLVTVAVVEVAGLAIEVDMAFIVRSVIETIMKLLNATIGLIQLMLLSTISLIPMAEVKVMVLGLSILRLRWLNPFSHNVSYSFPLNMFNQLIIGFLLYLLSKPCFLYHGRIPLHLNQRMV